MKSTLEEKVDELLNIQKKKSNIGLVVFTLVITIARILVNFFTTKLLWNIGGVALFGLTAIGNLQTLGLIFIISFFKYTDYSYFVRKEEELTKGKVFGKFCGYLFVSGLSVGLVWLLTQFI